MSGIDSVNTAVMKFSRNHPFLTKWVYTLPAEYEEVERPSMGPLLATKLLMSYCRVRKAH